MSILFNDPLRKIALRHMHRIMLINLQKISKNLTKILKETPKIKLIKLLDIAMFVKFELQLPEIFQIRLFFLN